MTDKTDKIHRTDRTYMSNMFENIGEDDFRLGNLYRLLASKVKGELLDVGCGHGLFLSMVGKKGIGIDIDRDSLRMAKKRGLDVRFGPAESIDRLFGRRRKFDTVTMLDVLEHIKDDERVIKKARSILKDGGSLIIVVPQYSRLYKKRDILLSHHRRYDRKDIIGKLERNGFDVRCRNWNAIGVLPYMLSDVKREKISRRMNAWLNRWFKIENAVDFGFGLSLILEARKRR